MKYKHISFDVWNTLIRTNPLFKIERISLLHKEYNPLGLKIEEVRDIVQSVDVMCNSINESTGKNIAAIEMYAMILYQMNFPCGKSVLIDLLHKCNTLFLEHHPFLYDTNTISVLEELKNKGITMSILSNTGFIEGRCMREALIKLGIMDFFEFRIFSDEVYMSKPDPLIFHSILDWPCTHLYKPKDILHVGDSMIADVLGANAIGMPALQINSNKNTIKTILDESLQLV